MTWADEGEGEMREKDILSSVSQITYFRATGRGMVHFERDDLMSEKCCYTHQIGRRDSQTTQFRGKVVEIYAPVNYEKTLSENALTNSRNMEKAPKAEVVLRNISGERENLDGLLFGTPEFIEVFLPRVRHIE